MKVKDLIEKLSKLDQDREIAIQDEYNPCCNMGIWIITKQCVIKRNDDGESAYLICGEGPTWGSQYL